MIFPPPSYDKQYWHLLRYFCFNVDLKSPLFGSHFGVISVFEVINLRRVGVFSKVVNEAIPHFWSSVDG
jgi:hypothetical protein